MLFAFNDSSIEKSRREIIDRRRQVERVFSVSRMAVFGNELIGHNYPGLIALSPCLLQALALCGFPNPVPQIELFQCSGSFRAASSS